MYFFFYFKITVEDDQPSIPVFLPSTENKTVHHLNISRIVKEVRNECYLKSSNNCLDLTFRLCRSFYFYIFLTVHLRIILVSDQLDAQFLL